jgi:hypothetical protein
MRVSRTVPIAAVAALALALVASPARADDPAAVLTSGAAGVDGVNVAAGDVLNASVATGTTANFSTAAWPPSRRPGTPSARAPRTSSA